MGLLRRFTFWGVIGYIFLGIFMIITLPFRILAWLGDKLHGVSSDQEPFLDCDVEKSYNRETDELTFTLNYRSFSHLIGILKQTSGYIPGQSGGADTDGDCWGHEHIEFAGEQFQIDVCGREFHLMNCRMISAPIEVWVRAVDLWEEILEERRDRIIILDKFQEGWCSEDSNGRLRINYRSNWRPSTS